MRVLERPEIPLHTNASENDIRDFVIKRKISGGTVSEKGRQARDVMLGLDPRPGICPGYAHSEATQGPRHPKSC